MALSEAGLVTALWVIGIYAGVLTVGIAVVAAVVFMVSRSRDGEGRITFKLNGTLKKSFISHKFTTQGRTKDERKWKTWRVSVYIWNRPDGLLHDA